MGRVDAYDVASWAGIQRRDYARGDLKPARVSRLQALPGWEWRPLDAQWERMFELLERYVEREGDSHVPDGHEEDGEPLGKWVQHQRTKYRGSDPSKGRLDESRVARLLALSGWTWERRSWKWEQHFAALVAFRDREGHLRVPDGHIENGLRLSRWVGNQKDLYKAGTLQRLAGNRVARLEALPGWRWTDPFEAKLGARIRRAREIRSSGGSHGGTYETCRGRLPARALDQEPVDQLLGRKDARRPYCTPRGAVWLALATEKKMTNTSAWVPIIQLEVQS